MYIQNIDRCKIPSDCVNVDFKQNQGLITWIHFQYRFIYGNIPEKTPGGGHFKSMFFNKIPVFK